METRLNVKDWRRQASHFDHSSTFSPASTILRKAGFKYHYTLKDKLIAEAIGGIGINPDSRVLDVGCGRGELLDRIRTSYNALCYGVDVSPKSLEEATNRSDPDLNLARSDGRQLPFADGSFDLITSLDVLEHIDSADKALREMTRVVRPGGRIILYAVSSENKFTLIWLTQKMYEMLGLDHWSWSCHHPDMLIDPEEVSASLTSLNCSLDRSEAFHAFFTLIVDLAMLGSYWLTSKIEGNLRLSKRIPSIFRFVIPLSTAVCRLLFNPLMRLDNPWLGRGLSNGHLFVATRLHERGREPPRTLGQPVNHHQIFRRENHRTENVSTEVRF